MIQALYRWMRAILLMISGVASATPALIATPAAAAPTAQTNSAPSTPLTSAALPASSVATGAVRAALAMTTPAAPTQAAANAPQARAAAIAQVSTTADTLAQSAIRGRTAIVRATAYNSMPNQTDSTPFITATGTRTRPGVVALSRDLLRQFPYGSKIIIEDLSGRYNHLLKGRVFMVEDTMAARKTNSLDIWMTTRSQAISFGARTVRITAVR